MGGLSPAALRKQIAAGQLDPVYLILGADDYVKNELADEFEAVVEPDLRPFNIERFDGGTVTLGDVLEAAQTLPMMAPRRIVIALRAERLLQPKRESQAATRDLEAFDAYLGQPIPTTTLVLVAEGLDKRLKINKKLLDPKRKIATVVQCGELKDVTDAQHWIGAQIKGAGVEAESAATQLLASIVGPDIVRLRGEVDRLLLYAAGQEWITVADVRAVAGPSVAHDDWAVARAIERGATGVALRELALALDAGAAPNLVLGQLAWVVRTRLARARVGPAVEAVFHTDLALKRSGGEPRVLLERLVVMLCDGGR